MLAVIIISGILSVILLFLIFVISEKSDESIVCQACAFLGGLFALSMIGCCMAIGEYCNPDINPMDVYQGKTTLKYEIIDGVKVDSTVVWKDEY